jgi:NADPH:quinone reductase-like Zn-dependent oxidoreductase
MHAAVVSAFDRPPQYEQFEDPTPAEGEVVVDVLAAGLHPRVRSSADGSHYTEVDALPLIPGIDGVGRGADGRAVYFVLPDTPRGSMAERAAIDPRRSVVLPDGVDPVTIAAAMNPAMSSWLALRERIEPSAGTHVLVLGATGNAGRLAVQIARRLGAGRVTAAGRDAAGLAALEGADTAVELDAVAPAAADADVIIDYLWGSVTEQLIPAVVRARHDRAQALDWIEVGSVAGTEITLPSAALRAANLRVLGSGQGSISTGAIVAALPELATEISSGAYPIDAVARPLSEVAAAWVDTATGGRRTVLVP